MRLFSALLLPLLFSVFTPLLSQDTLSFGGIYDLPGAEVRATYTPVSPLAQQFTIEEVYRLPGTFYDPARLVALLPGVVQTNDQANHLSVRGNTPNANLWRLNGLAIVNPNHTANAGTFYDFPTLSGGGVNAISAQMLGNSGFLAGGLPVEYGYATGGTFDLRLRPGDKNRRKYQAQVGFIGFDLMAEGPIGNSGKTSYLVNGRYSFTGLLADMGVDFGGEEIRFWDFNGHLHHEWDGGELSLFSIVGASSNVFAGPDSSETEIMEQKELFDIDFESALNIYGTSFQHAFGKVQISGGISYSETESERTQRFSRQDLIISDQLINFQRTNANLALSHNLSSKSELKIGAEFLRQNLAVSIGFRDDVSSIEVVGNPIIDAVSPFVGYNFIGDKNDYHIGVRVSRFSGVRISETVIEPRLHWSHKFKRSTFSLNFEIVSLPPTFERLFVSPSSTQPRQIPRAFQLSARYGRKIGPLNVSATVFTQENSDEYGPGRRISNEGSVVSANNLLEINPFVEFGAQAISRRFGLELEFAGGDKTKGWYYRGSGTLLRSLSTGVSGGFSRSRFDIPYQGKLTAGKEWAGKDKKERSRTYGVNLALIIHGGERYGLITPSGFEPAVSTLQYFTPPSNLGRFINTTGTYFRPDLRLYKTKTRPKTTTTLALDIQNAANVQNLANVYYDAFLERPNERYQLGLIPVLSYRIVWR